MSSGCGDVLSLEDLKTAKKNQIFEAEVITGRAGGVAGGASIDFATNQVTGQTQKTLPAVLRDAGFRPASFTFVTGGVLAVGDSDMAVLWPISAGGDGAYYIWKGAYPKAVPASSTPASSGGVSDSGWMQLGDITLRSELANGTDTIKGDALVAVSKSFTGAGATTQHEVNERTVHINDFPSSPANTWLHRAIEGTPDGWTLQLGLGPYMANYQSSRNNITISGCGAPPAVNATRTAMVAGTGTIVQGSLKFSGSNVLIRNLGVDNGTDVTTATGVQGDALVVSNVGISTTPNVNNHVHNVVTLAKLGSSTAHSCLLENFTNSSVLNVKGYGGFVGVVCKLQNSFIDNVAGYRNTQSGVQLKSDSYAPFARNEIGKLYADDEGLNAANSVGIFVYAATAPIEHLIGGVFGTRGFATGTSITMTTGQPISNVNIESISAESPTSMGFSAFGGILQSRIGGVQVTRPSSGKSVYLDPLILGLDIGSIQAASPSGLNLDDSVNLGGVFSVGSIVATQEFNPTILTGITVSPGTAAATAWWIGNYIGRLIANNITLQNGWVAAGGGTPKLRLNGKSAMITAYITVPATRTGAEVWTTIPTALRPTTPQTIACIGFVSGTAAPVPIIGAINTSGAVYFPYLSNASQFPLSVVQVAFNAAWPIS